MMRLLNHGSVPEEEISKMKDALNLEHVSRRDFFCEQPKLLDVVICNKNYPNR